MTLSKNFMNGITPKEHKENVNTKREETTNNSWNGSCKWISNEKTMILFIKREEIMRSYEFDEDCDESTIPWTSFIEEIKHVVIGQQITAIGNYAFSNCTSLSSITIPDTATTIGNGTFYKCTSLEAITLPESVTMIGNKSFEHCTSVTSLALPETSKVIDSRALYGCSHYVLHGTMHVVRCHCATQPSSIPKYQTSHSAFRAKRGTAST